MSENKNKTDSKVEKALVGLLGTTVALPVIALIIVALMLVLGFTGYFMGWVMELVAGSLVYGVLDVIPTQPFSKGDLPKIFAILASLSSMLSIGNVFND